MTERIGPYRVYERLGVGGMGEVFKAYDDRLDRWVAIKRIRPDRLDAEDNRERFKREARATARLNHPAIVHLYGIFQDEEDADCIVMEFVDGRTLDTYLSEGPLEPERVAQLGHEIASGLAEAHANGILHRDLKAENIMITPRGRAKILDFGLAKPILSSELDPVLTSKGQLVGTSRAMSPEYVSGEEVDHRSDLFALGVLLYECLTGQSPFKAHNTLATLKQVMLHKQAPVSQLNPDVPPELSELIERLLSKDPGSRPQSAEEVALAFGRITGQASSGVIDSPNLGSGGHSATGTTSSITASDTVLDLRPRNRRIAVLVILAVALVGAFFLGRLFVEPSRSEPDLPPDERLHIVLGVFENRTGEEMLGASLAEAFRAALDQSRSNTVLSESQIQDTLSRMQLPSTTEIDREVGIEICEREGAERLVVGTVSKLGRSYSVVVDVVDPVEDRNTLSASGSAKGEEELLSTIEDLALEVRAHLGESAVEIEKAIPLEKVTTSNLDALKAYTIGQSHAALGASGQAVDFFKRAIMLDPGFAMAHAKLGVALTNVGEDTSAVESFTKALDLEDGLSEVQKLYLKGWLARREGSPSKVIANFSLMADLYPENYIASYNLGQALWVYHNDFQGATDAFRSAARAARGSEKSLVFAQLGRCLVALEQIEEAKTYFEESSHQNRISGSIAIDMIEGRRDEATALVTELNEQTTMLLEQALIAAYFGDLEKAREHLASAELAALARDDSETLFRVLAGQGEIAFLLDDGPGLLQVARRSRGLIPGNGDQVSPTATSLLLLLAKLVIRMGDDDDLAREFLGSLASQEESHVQTATAFLSALEAEMALVDERLDVAGERAELANSLADSVQLMETLATVRSATGDEKGARLLFQEISRRRGLGLIDCSSTSSCLGRIYSALLPALVSHGLDQGLDSLERRRYFFHWPDLTGALVLAEPPSSESEVEAE